MVVKNVCGILSLGFLKSALSQEWIDEISWFFACWYKIRKAKSYFDNYWLCMVKNWWGLIDHGTLKLGVSHYLFNEFEQRLTEWFLMLTVMVLYVILEFQCFFFSTITLQWALCSFFSKFDHYIYIEFSIQQFSFQS